MRPTILALVTVLGCRGATGGGPVTAIDVPQPRMAGAVVRAEPPRGSPDDWPLHAPLPEEVACRWDRSGWTGEVHVAGWEDGAVASVSGSAEVDLVLGTGSQGAIVDVRAGPLRLRGMVPQSKLRLLPRQQLQLGDFVNLKPWAELRVDTAQPDAVVVTLAEAPRDLHDLESSLLRTVFCAEVGLRQVDFDPFEYLGVSVGTQALRGPTVRLSGGPGGAITGILALESGRELLVTVLWQTATHSKIALDRGDNILVAWVENRQLGTTYATVGPVGQSIGLGGIGTRGGGPTERRTCDRALPVGVARGERVARVGTLDAGSTIVIVATRDDGFTTISVRPPGVSTDRLSELVARTAHVERCSRPG